MLPQSEIQIASMFDRIAGRYDFLNKLLSMRQDLRWRKHLIRGLPRGENLNLLDVATGTGDVLLTAAKKRKDYKQFLGVDISKNMLQVAEKKAAQLDLAKEKNLNFQVMSAMNLELKDASYSAITIAFGLRNVVDKPKALSEFFRVLKPGGRLQVLEFFTPRKSFFSKLFNFYFYQILPRIGALLSDATAYRYLPQSVGSFYRVEELAHALKLAGFAQLQIRTFLFGSCCLVRADKD